LRQKDFFKSVAEALNKVIKQQKEKDARVSSLLEDLKNIPQAQEKIKEAGF